MSEKTKLRIVVILFLSHPLYEARVVYVIQPIRVTADPAAGHALR